MQLEPLIKLNTILNKKPKRLSTTICLVSVLDTDIHIEKNP